MAEYIQSNATEVVNLDNPITFDSSISCTRGYVIHENGTGGFILRGIVNNATCSFARYQVTFNGNIAIPTGGDVTPIAIGISVNGEVRQSSKAIFTPAAAGDYGNVTSTAIITVPRGCCFNLAIDYISAAAVGVTPTPSIEVQNGNVTITRIA